MKATQIIMDMPVIVEIVDESNPDVFNKIFDYFHWVDKKFSTFKKTSEISKINDGLLKKSAYSKEMKEIFRLAEQTKKETNGYFDIEQNGKLDPSGIVKGWAIHNAADILRKKRITNFYVEIAGDIEVSGNNPDGKPWVIGIRNPFNVREIVKVVHLTDRGIATSGNYERGNHIYIPQTNGFANEIASITVIGPNVYEADRYATAAFAMGKKGIEFLEHLKGFAGYMIGKDRMATLTTNITSYETN